MKMTIPVRLHEALCSVNWVLAELASAGTSSWTCNLRKSFIPRQMKWREEKDEGKLQAWADGVYVKGLIKIYGSNYGEHGQLEKLSIKAKQYYTPNGRERFTFFEVDIPALVNGGDNQKKELQRIRDILCKNPGVEYV